MPGRILLFNYMQKIVSFWFFCLMPGLLLAQKAIDRSKQIDTAGKKDLIDVGKEVLHVGPKPIDTTRKRSVYFSLLPVSLFRSGGGTALLQYCVRLL